MTDQRLKLLIVDDEEAHVEAIRRAFEEAGGNVEIESVASLHEFRVSVVAQRPDLALMDLNLPDGRAVEVLTHPPEDAPFPVLVMTAFGNQQIVVEVMKAGALDYVVKSPAAFTNMPRTVEHALREWELLRKNQRAEAALRASEASLQSILGSTAEGILAVNDQGRMLKFNQRFADMWRIPQAELDTLDSPALRVYVANQLVDPDAFLKEVQRLYQTDEISRDTLAFKDGRVFERHSAPLIIGGAVKGRVWSFSDITAHEQAEAARQHSERNYREIFNAANEAIFIHDEQGTVLDVNDSMLALYGFTREEALRLKANVSSEGVSPYSAEEARQWMAKAVTEGPQVFEWRARKKSGELFWVEVALKSATISGQRRILAVVRDITERKRAAELMRNMAQRFQAILNKQHYGILVANAADTVEFVNQSFCDLMDLREPPEKLIGLYADQMVPKVLPAYADAVKTLAQLQAVLSTQAPSFDNEIVMCDGRVLLVDFVPLVIEGKNTGRMWLHRDITERKRVEAALRKSEEQLKFALEGANDGLWDVDLLTNSVYLSPRGCEMFGYRPDEFSAQIEQWNQMVHPDDLPPTQAALAAYMQGRAPLFQVEQRLQTKTGDYKWILARGKISGRDAAGQPIRMTGTHTDITERKRAETALRESEARLVRAQAVAHVGNWELNLATATMWASAEAVRIYGFAPDISSLPLEQVQQLVVADDRQRLDAALRALIQTQQNYNVVFRIERACDGVERVIHSMATVECAAEGRALKVVGTLQDITEQQRAEDDVRESQALLGSVLNSSLSGIMAFKACRDAHGNIEYFEWQMVNLAAEQMVGRSKEDLLGKHLLVEMPGNRSEGLFDRYVRVVETGVPMSHEHYYEHEKVKTWFHTSAVKLGDGFVVTFANITARKRADEAQARLATAVEQAAETIVITDPQGTIVYANPAFEKITGYTRTEALGQNPRILKSDKHDAAFYKLMWDTLNAGQVWSGRIINKRKDGKLIEEEATLSPVYDTAGKLINFVAVKRDVTHEVALEAQNRQAAKMEAIGQLAGGVAHDFNNKLQIILGCAEVILDGLPEDHALRADLQEIQHAARHSADLTRQLLAFSRKQMIAPVNLDVNATLSGSMKMFTRVLGENIRLSFTLARENWRVFMDPMQFDQLLANLTVNARDAIAGTGNISIAVANVSFRANDGSDKPEFVAPGDYVTLAISDDGVGMTQEIQSHIFEPFFTTKGVGKGTGLGLATVYGIVKQNNGSITVRSAPGQGTTFTLYLPRVAAAESSAATTKAAAHKPTGSETILLVEDEDSVLTLVTRTLEQQGYHVLTAATPQAALAICQSYKEKIHLLLTDVIMPVIGGKELADRVEALRPDIRVLFMSGYTADLMELHGHLPDGIRILQKPFTGATLAQRIRAALDAHPTPLAE